MSEAPAAVQRNRAKRMIIFATAVVAGIVLLCVFLRVSGLGLRLTSTIGPPIEGQIAFIRVDTPRAIVARDMAALEQAATAGLGGEAILAMEADGRIYLVANGTRVRVLDAAARGYRIEIIDGEYAGKTGYTAAAFVQH